MVQVMENVVGNSTIISQEQFLTALQCVKKDSALLKKMICEVRGRSFEKSEFTLGDLYGDGSDTLISDKLNLAFMYQSIDSPSFHAKSLKDCGSILKENKGFESVEETAIHIVTKNILKELKKNFQQN